MIEISRRQRLRRSLDLTPLIDVVFQLLVFFLLTATFARFGAPLRLPEVESAEPTAREGVVVAIDAEGQISVDGAAVSVLDLEGALVAALKAHRDRQGGAEVNARVRSSDARVASGERTGTGDPAEAGAGAGSTAGHPPSSLSLAPGNTAGRLPSSTAPGSTLEHRSAELTPGRGADAYSGLEQTPIFVRGDVRTRYGVFMRVLDACRKVGISNVILESEVGEPPPGAAEPVEGGAKPKDVGP